jgi:hypothetical protein
MLPVRFLDYAFEPISPDHSHERRYWTVNVSKYRMISQAVHDFAQAFAPFIQCEPSQVPSARHQHIEDVKHDWRRSGTLKQNE